MCIHVCAQCDGVFECATRCTLDPDMPQLCSTCENEQYTVGQCYHCREIEVLPPRAFYFDAEERARHALTLEPGDTCESCLTHLPFARSA